MSFSSNFPPSSPATQSLMPTSTHHENPPQAAKTIVNLSALEKLAPELSQSVEKIREIYFICKNHFDTCFQLFDQRNEIQASLENTLREKAESSTEQLLSLKLLKTARKKAAELDQKDEELERFHYSVLTPLTTYVSESIERQKRHIETAFLKLNEIQEATTDAERTERNALLQEKVQDFLIPEIQNFLSVLSITSEELQKALEIAPHSPSITSPELPHSPTTESLEPIPRVSFTIVPEDFEERVLFANNQLSGDTSLKQKQSTLEELFAHLDESRNNAIRTSHDLHQSNFQNKKTISLTKAVISLDQEFSITCRQELKLQEDEIKRFLQAIKQRKDEFKQLQESCENTKEHAVNSIEMAFCIISSLQHNEEPSTIQEKLLFIQQHLPSELTLPTAPTTALTDTHENSPSIKLYNPWSLHELQTEAEKLPIHHQPINLEILESPRILQTNLAQNNFTETIHHTLSKQAETINSISLQIKDSFHTLHQRLEQQSQLEGSLQRLERDNCWYLAQNVYAKHLSRNAPKTLTQSELRNKKLDLETNAFQESITAWKIRIKEIVDDTAFAFRDLDNLSLAHTLPRVSTTTQRTVLVLRLQVKKLHIINEELSRSLSIEKPKLLSAKINYTLKIPLQKSVEPAIPQNRSTSIVNLQSMLELRTYHHQIAQRLCKSIENSSEVQVTDAFDNTVQDLEMVSDIIHNEIASIRSIQRKALEDMQFAQEKADKIRNITLSLKHSLNESRVKELSLQFDHQNTYNSYETSVDNLSLLVQELQKAEIDLGEANISLEAASLTSDACQIVKVAREDFLPKLRTFRRALRKSSIT
jgi:exonuclease VII small subunit